jgi:hypothetical protein
MMIVERTLEPLTSNRRGRSVGTGAPRTKDVLKV